MFVELPGGNKNKNETPIDAANRELREESRISFKKTIELEQKKGSGLTSAYKLLYTIASWLFGFVFFFSKISGTQIKCYRMHGNYWRLPINE